MINMHTQILDWVTNTGRVCSLLAVIVWVIFHRRFPQSFKYLGIYLIANLIIQFVAELMWQKGQNNLPLLHVNTLLEFVFFTLFFKDIYLQQEAFKKHVFLFIGGISLLLLINSIWFEPFFEMNSNARTLVQIIIIAYVVIYIFDVFGKIALSENKAMSISLICFVTLIYYAGSLSTFMLSDFIVAKRSGETGMIWMINASLYTIFQIIILFSIMNIALQRFSPLS